LLGCTTGDLLHDHLCYGIHNKTPFEKLE